MQVIAAKPTGEDESFIPHENQQADIKIHREF